MLSIDQAINRKLLTEFGPCDTWQNAYKTLASACQTMIANGGGVIVVPNGIDPSFEPRNSLQANMVGVLIEDYRGGALRLVVPPEESPDIYSDVGGGMIVERDIVNDIQGQGGGAAVAIANRSRSGVNSVNDVLLDVVFSQLVPPSSQEVRFYVTSLRGLCPGNWVDINSSLPIQIKELGADPKGFFFVADLDQAYVITQAKTFAHKNWFSALDINDTHNCDDQSGTLNVERTTYGSGDSFGVQVSYSYSSDIMSAGGDEGGVLYSAEVNHDIDMFWGTVESWDSGTQKLVYMFYDFGNPQNPNNPKNPPENWWKIGTSRPIINMNPARWNQTGKIIVTQTNVQYNGIDGVIGDANVQWDNTIIGKFISIDDPSEYYLPGENPPGVATNVPGTHIVRRWFRISNASQINGLWTLGIETVWDGSHIGGKPKLLNPGNYYTPASPKELSYIIAPGAWAINVSNALGGGPGKYSQGMAAQRTIQLAPFPNSLGAFEKGDLITQPPGPTPWTPTSYRTRHFNWFPALMEGMGFEVENSGATTVGHGLQIGGATPDVAKKQTMADFLSNRKDGLPAFGAGVSIDASTQHAIQILGATTDSTIFVPANTEESAITISGACKNYALEIFATASAGAAAILINC